MNRNTKARREAAHDAAKKGQKTSTFSFGNFTQTITVGTQPRLSKRPKVAGHNFKEEKHTDGEITAIY